MTKLSRPGARRVAGPAATRAAAACLCCASVAWADAGADAGADGLRLVTGDDFGDFSGQTLERGGMATQIVREALAAAGEDAEILFDDWEAGYAAASAGTVDAAFPWYYLPGREADFVYTDSIYELVERIFLLDGDPDVPDISTADDLAGLTLCYPAGWGAPASIQALLDDGRLARTSPGDMSRCFDLLANEQVDIVLSPQLQGYETVEAHPKLDAFDVATASWEVTVRTLGVLVPKALGRERACGIAASFDAGLATLRANGYFDAVVRRWFGSLAQLAAPDEITALVRRTPTGDEAIEGRAIGLSGGRFLVDAGEDGLHSVPLDEIRWIGRAGTTELAGSKAWCIDDAGPAGPAAPVRPAAASPGPSADRTLEVAGPMRLADTLLPALVSGWLEREVRAYGAGFAVADASNDPREPDRLDVRARDVDAAFESLASSDAELVLADRPPTAAESRALAPVDAFPSEATEHVFALEALTLVAHPSRDLAAVPLDALARALAGGAPTWRELGARGVAGAPDIQVDDAAAAALSSGGASLGGLPAPGPGVRRRATRLDVLAAVANDPGALGVVMLHDDPDGRAGGARATDEPRGSDELARNGVRAVPLSDCGLVHAPGGFAARTEEYPLARRLYMYHSPARDGGFAGPLVRHAQSDAGQRTVAEHGLVGLSIEPGPPRVRDEMLANLARTGVQDEGVGTGLAAATDGATRLSTTFRFRTASARLDARAVRDAERLAAWLRDGGLDGEDIALVGYADSRGGYARNCRLSRSRVESIAGALAREGVDGAPVTFAACEEAPVACNATGAGQDLNRRVEVWRRAAPR